MTYCLTVVREVIQLLGVFRELEELFAQLDGPILQKLKLARVKEVEPLRHVVYLVGYCSVLGGLKIVEKYNE